MTSHATEQPPYHLSMPLSDAFFALLRAGLWEQPVANLSLFPLTAEAWSELYATARHHTVTAIVWQGVSQLPDELMPPEALLLKWVVEVDRIEQRNRTMDAAVVELMQLFDAQGLHAVLQKGQGVATFYEHPLYRECGDIDLYFPHHADFERAAALLEQHHIAAQRAADSSLHYAWQGISVEHHRWLFDMASSARRKELYRLESYYGFVAQVLATVTHKPVRVPAPLLHLLLLNTHILKHALGWGIGLRQLCDLARAYHHLQGQYDEAELHETLRALRIGKWSDLLHAFLIMYMGMPATFVSSPVASARPQALLRLVERSGNFGTLRRTPSAAARPSLLRKCHTAQAFIHQLPFACTYAPGEAAWTVMALLMGQRL